MLAAGHEARATVRDLARESAVRAMLHQGKAGAAGERLALFQADLNADAGWGNGCIFHAGLMMRGDRECRPGFR
jgi:dihydroflavonol-4-reductase